MKNYFIKLGSIDDVKKFVNIVTLCDSDFDLVSGRYIVDAKSIMGILSLDLQNSLELKIHSPSDEIENKLKEFLV